jgi:hypothetical protein
MVTGRYGPGRSVYVGFQGTWLWRRLGLTYFERFWIQTVRFLVQGRLLRGRTRGRILTNRDVYGAGDRISVTAKLYDPEYQPLKRSAVSATLQGKTRGQNGKRTIQLQPVPGKPGEYEGSAIARFMGTNVLAVELREPDGNFVTVSRQFTVEMPNVESANPRMNESLLRNLTRRSGGRYFGLSELKDLPSSIPDRRATTVVHGSPVPLWDTSRVLLLIVILLTAEWALRKKFRLM